MNYKEAKSFLFKELPFFQKQGEGALKMGLENIQVLCDLLGNPQNDYPTIHIAGTNGKGSTAHILAAILQKLDYKIGMYTSPHYKDFRERIKINGEYISKNSVIGFLRKYKKEIEAIKPSFFEVMTAMAFRYFKQKKVDIAIIEAGLGGELDSTNILKPMFSIITNVGYDHTNILGNTLEEIATQKAGVIKPNIPVVIGLKQAETIDIFKSKAEKENAPIFFTEDYFEVKREEYDYKSDLYTIRYLLSHDDDIVKYLSDLKGEFQTQNIGTALMGFDNVFEYGGFSLSSGAIDLALREVKETTNFKGRWDVLQEKPIIIADSGHNVEAIHLSMQTLSKIDCQQLHIVLGLMSDKPIDKILEILPISANYYFCSPDSDRSLSAEALKSKANAFGLKGLAFDNIQTAFISAKEAANENDLIFVGGSSYVVGEVV